MSELQPVQFGKYILMDKVATGGMAELYRAKMIGAKGFEKLIAIKKILPHLTSEESLIKSFIDEAKLAAFLQHPNIIQIYDFGSTEGTYFLAMEYLFGKDMKFIIKKSEMTDKLICLDDALLITIQICNGLFYAHNLKNFQGESLNIIHRDIGPQNIFLTYDGQVKIIDFGIAKAANQNSCTQEDFIKGKLAYMSPEQARGKKINHQSDIFSIGIMLYELATHKRMYAGDTYKIYTKVCDANFDPAEKANKDLPPILYDILNRALSKKPEHRYQSAEEMASDLEMCLSQLSNQTTTKSLSQYIKDLCKNEAEAEERAMREAALFDTKTTSEHDDEISIGNEPTEILEKPTSANAQDETIAIEINGTSEKRNLRPGLYAVLALIFAVSGLSLAWISMGNRTDDTDMGAVTALTGHDNSIKTQSPELTQGPKPAENTSSPERKTSQSDQDIPELKKIKELLNEKHYKEANKNFDAILAKNPSIQQSLIKSVETNPKDASSHYLLGRIYTNKKDNDNALLSYKKAIESGTDIAYVYFNLGFIYYQIKNDYSRAQDMYERTVELSPSFLDEALYMLAIAQIKQKNKQAGIKNLEKALIVNPDNKPAKTLLDRQKNNN